MNKDEEKMLVSAATGKKKRPAPATKKITRDKNKVAKVEEEEAIGARKESPTLPLGEEAIPRTPLTPKQPLFTGHNRPVDWPTREDYTRCCGRVKRVGTLYVLIEWRDSKHRKRRIFLGPYWHFLLTTILFLAGITFFVYVDDVVPRSWTIVRICGLTTTALSFASLALAASSDPGIFPRYYRRLEPHWTYSDYSQSYRPPGTVFCQELQLLIEDYNHFCPWIGTAVGKGNETYFHLFITSLTACLLYDAVLIGLALHSKDL